MSCPQSAVTQEKLCSLESDVKHPQPSKATALQCGQAQSAQLRCVGCNSTSPGDWPWMARLLYKENIGQGSLVTSCGGVLVSSRHVITAGHCLVAGQEPDRVALGDSNISTEFDCLDTENGCGMAGRQCFESGFCAPRL